MGTRIEWADETWCPIRTADGGYHCTKISEGCAHCYAERFNSRFGNKEPFNNSPVKFVLDQKQLEKPFHWRKPRRIFVQSMGDLFHEDVPFELVAHVYEVIKNNPQHQFIVLTKRVERALEFYGWNVKQTGHYPGSFEWLKNVCFMVTTENQDQADKRIPGLLKIPSHKRGISAEPLLSAINLDGLIPPPGTKFKCSFCGGYTKVYSLHCQSCGKEGGYSGSFAKLSWCVCGGETGPGARPVLPDWVRSLRDQCQAAGTPFFFKSWGYYCAPSQMPEATYRAWDYYHGTENCWKEDDPTPWNVGKKAAGRLLDGREWNEFPEVAAHGR